MNKPKFKIGDIVKFKTYNSGKIHCGKICLIEWWVSNSINCYGIVGSFSLDVPTIPYNLLMTTVGFVEIDKTSNAYNLIGAYITESLIVSKENNEEFIYL